MEWIKRWLIQARIQLSNLNTSEQMLIGTLMVVIPMLFFGVAQYASTPERVSLLDQPFTGDERSRITQHLRSIGVDFELAGDFINVPSEKRNTILASLSTAQMLPDDTSQGFQAMIEKQTWWQSSAQTKQMLRIALQSELERTIKSYPWVHNARVMISMPEQKGFGSQSSKPSASVSIDMQSGTLTQRYVDSVVGLVAGAKAELMPTDVTVIDEKAGRPWRVRDNDMMGSDNQYLENQQLVENSITKKISDALSYLKDKIVVVNADINQTWVKTNEVAYDKETSVGLVTKTMSSNTESNTGGNGGEPGIRANVGVSITGSGEGTKNTSSDNEESFEAYAGYKHEVSADPGGHATRVSATVSIPRSFFVMLWMRGKPADTPEPTDEALQPLIDAYLSQVKSQIELLVIANDTPGEVSVGMYPDMLQAGFITEEQATLVGSLIAQATPSTLGVGALGIVSMMMMMMMMRRASRKPISPSVRELAGIPETLESSDDDVIGDAAEYDEALDGVELDDETLRHRKLVEQMTEMIQENPGEVATLVKRMVKQDA